MAQTRRVQILMDPIEYQALAATAASQQCSVAEVIRSALRAQHQPGRAHQLAAARRVVAMDLGADFAWTREDLEDAVVAEASERAVY